MDLLMNHVGGMVPEMLQKERHAGSTVLARDVQHRAAVARLAYRVCGLGAEVFEEEAEALDLTVVQGNRMSHLLQAGTSKGQALEALKDHFDQKVVHVLALGDSPNDLPLLNAGDHSVVVPGAQGAHPKLRASMASGDFALAPAAHALGCACSVLSLVRTLVPPALAATAP